MTEHTTRTREEWLSARLELLEAEKELTRRSDELARRRQQLPCLFLRDATTGSQGEWAVERAHPSA